MALRVIRLLFVAEGAQQMRLATKGDLLIAC